MNKTIEIAKFVLFGLSIIGLAAAGYFDYERFFINYLYLDLLFVGVVSSASIFLLFVRTAKIAKAERFRPGALNISKLSPFAVMSLFPILTEVIATKNVISGEVIESYFRAGFIVLFAIVLLMSSRNSVRERPRVPALNLLILTIFLGVFGADLIFSVNSGFYSAIIWAIYIILSFAGFLAVLTLLKISPRRSGESVDKSFDSSDSYAFLGKYLFGFSFFWAYLAFSFIMIVWQANLPYEAEFTAPRFLGYWKLSTYNVFLFGFVLPFFLLIGKRFKTNKINLKLSAISILAAQVFSFQTLVYPARFETFFLSYPELSALIFFFLIFTILIKNLNFKVDLS